MLYQLVCTANYCDTSRQLLVTAPPTTPRSTINATDDDSVLLYRLIFPTPQRTAVSEERRSGEGRAHMLLGNHSFSVPTQAEDSQQDAMAAQPATINTNRALSTGLARSDRRSSPRIKVSI